MTTQIGPEGVEPPPPGYQPSVLPLNYGPSVGRRVSRGSAPGESNPSSLAYKASALAVELGALDLMGPEGFEPPPTGLKGRHATATPRPRAGLLVPGSWFDPVHRVTPPATFVRESGRPDSNRRSQAPRACGLARLSHALVGSFPPCEQPVWESNPPLR